MSLRTFWLCAAAAGALLTTSPAFAADTDVAATRYGTWGVDLTAQGKGIKPGDDFYRFANGAGLDRMEIPPDRPTQGSFYLLRDLSEARVKALVEGLAAGRKQKGEAAKVGDFFKAFMDEARVEQLGAAPLARDLAAIRGARDHDALAAVLGSAPKTFQSSIFGVYIGADEKAPDRYTVYLGQAGLGLPDRDYYLTEQFAPQKAKYEAYAAQLLGLAGWSNPEAAAKAVVAFETRIAEVSWTRAEQRNRDKTYNPMTVAELEKAAPGFAWRAFFAAGDLGKRNRLVIGESTAIPKIAAIYAETPIETLQAWAAFRLADNASPYLSKAFTDARFEFRSKALSGTLQQRERWKRGVTALEQGLGEAVGRLYVAKYFPPEAKAKMDALVAELKVAMGQRIDAVDWMSPPTKAEAQKKLAQFNVKIGYPTKWRNYSALTVKPDDLYGNMERSIAFDWKREVSRLDKKVDRDEWHMTPQTVNAYYDSTMNEIVFPAAILQPPFFDPEADAAVNYGAIGAVIGHEITHGFDDQGRKSDGTGALREWWTPVDAERFDASAKRLGGQYDSYEVLPGAHVKGDLTMGENVADLGGLLTALDAYHLSLEGKPAPVIDGLTGDQRFFLAFAQVWLQKSREEALRQQVVSDPHSPAEFRTNGVVRNVDAWYEAFGVKPGDKLYLAPEQRVRIW